MAPSSRLFQKTRNNFKTSKNRPYITHPPPPYDKRGSPNCITCGVQLTIKHIFTECRNNPRSHPLIRNLLSGTNCNSKTIYFPKKSTSSTLEM